MKTILEVKNLSKQYSQNYAVQNVSLTIREGDIYGLIGKNGAGKTTLLKLITQLIEPTSGTISLFGSSTDKERSIALKRTGSVIEIPVAYDQLTASENLRYYCKLRGIVHAEKIIQDTLSLVHLTDTGSKKFKKFSLGMKQKLGIAIAILSKPDFLILDEPINGLDPLAIIEFRQLIQNLNKEYGMTIIISSHILSELYQIATRFSFLDNGMFIREISKHEFDQLNNDFIILETTEIEKASQFLQEQLSLKIKVVYQQQLHIFGELNQINAITKALVAENIPINGIHYTKQRLEEYFSQLIDSSKEE